MDKINKLISITQEIQALENAASLIEEYSSLEEELDVIQKKVLELEDERDELVRELEADSIEE